METIQKVNEFMGTSRSPELIQQIADATSFSKMKEAKAESLDSVNSILGKVSMESVFLLVYAHHTCGFVISAVRLLPI